MKTKQRRQPQVKPLTVSTYEANRNLNSFVILQRRELLEFELGQVEMSIAALLNAVADTRRRKVDIEAKIQGLSSVIARR